MLEVISSHMEAQNEKDSEGIACKLHNISSFDNGNNLELILLVSKESINYILSRLFG